MVEKNIKIEIENLSAFYGPVCALKEISCVVYEREIFGIIGPANSGKSTLLKCLNRMSDFVRGMRVQGKIMFDGEDVLKIRNTQTLRRKIGMVMPLPVGLPLSIRDNVLFAPRMAGIGDKEKLEEILVESLTNAALWDEVKDRLDSLATRLSGGQQQRLTLARALSHGPRLLCLDEFSIAIDPVTTMRIEEVLERLRSQITIILVTNMVHQARRLADRTAMMLDGKIIEVGETKEIFSGHAKEQTTLDYVEGRFG